MRSVMAGRDLKMFNDELKEKYGATTKRARLIALDQCNKATAAVRQTRALEAGLEKAKWVHSGAGREPRKSHVEANGKIFNIAEGCLIDGEHISPGEKIRCRCSMRVILPI